jgi:pimeloyl-ACP methyl ester carboxylesterase
MGYYEQLDEEIDKEMGWTDGKSGPRRPGNVSAFTLLQLLLRRIRLPRPVANALGSLGRGFAKVAFFPLISPLGYSKSFNVEGDMMVVKRSWKWRIVDGLLTRALLTPVILAIFLVAIVYSSTHPQRVTASATPESLDLYYKRVRLVTVDGQGLHGWYVPPITASEMSFNPEASLFQKWPGVVLCHGLGASQEQYLPMAKELHKAGFAVLMLDMRGQGESDSAAVTYGLRERLDVLAGVKYLRELPNIDRTKVCVVGHDIGAVATLQAASLDPSIAAVVADGMWPKFETRARNIFSRPSPTAGSLPIGWLGPLYTVAFEVAVRDRLSQLDPELVVRNIHSQPVLFIARQGAPYAPVPDVLSLATSVGSRHEVVVAPDTTDNRDVEQKVAAFLTHATNWKAPKVRGTEAIEKLLEKRVK